MILRSPPKFISHPETRLFQKSRVSQLALVVDLAPKTHSQDSRLGTQLNPDSATSDTPSVDRR
jgi:hypothetical protein